jgi:hypothetical protein
MITPSNITLDTTAASLQQLYAVYMHLHCGVPQYIGVTPLHEVFTLQDARCNSMWGDIFARDRTSVLEIRVLATTTIEREAYDEQRRLVLQHRPVCNIKGRWIDPKRQRVECVQTGEIFDNASDAAKAHNVAYSQLSNHLNSKPGHRTVKGRTYVRTMKERAL